MQIRTLSARGRQRPAIVVRVLTILLAAFAVVAVGQAVDYRLVTLGAGYSFVAALLWRLSSRLPWPWLPYPIALVDVAAVTAFIALSAGSAFPVWALYLFPLTLVAMAKRSLIGLVAGSSILGLIGATWLNTGTVPVSAIWSVAVLVATALILAAPRVHWIARREDRRSWQEIAQATQALADRPETDAATAVIAERARRLVRADRAWIWWRGDADRFRLAVKTDEASGNPLDLGPFSPELKSKLDRGPVSLADFGEPMPSNVNGDALLLWHHGAQMALLAVAWNRPPSDRAGHRQRLRAFAAWAAEALVQARAQSAERKARRRETVLREAAAKMLAIVDEQAIRQILIQQARAGLDAAVSLVERPSGRVLAGDTKVAEALVRMSLTLEPELTQPDVPQATARPPDAPIVAHVTNNLALLAWRAEPLLDEAEAAWLDELAAAVRSAIERCAAHEQLRQEADRLRMSLEAMPAPVALRNRIGEVVLANTAYQTLVLPTVLAGQTTPSGVDEGEMIVGDPPRIFVGTTVAVDDGQYLLSFLREITRERQALHARDELIAMMGHELRTPLATIHGYSQLMASQLGIVLQQVDQVNRLIGDLLDVPRLESGQLELTRELVDIGQAVRAAVERFRGIHERRELRVELADGVQPVEADPMRLAQVIDNLLTNAAKYSPADTAISVRSASTNGEVLLAISDQGLGISPEHLPRLFDRFYRAPTVETDDVPGVGLGLSIVRDIVAAHGGRFWAESAGLGHGSTFYVTFPASERRNLQQRQSENVG